MGRFCRKSQFSTIYRQNEVEGFLALAESLRDRPLLKCKNRTNTRTANRSVNCEIYFTTLVTFFFYFAD